MNTVKFEAGKTYQMRSIGDYNCVWTFEVIRRTEKSIWVSCDGECKNKRLVVSIWDNVEQVRPFGTYSMSPSLRASSVVENVKSSIDVDAEAAACEAEYISDNLVNNFFAKILA